MRMRKSEMRMRQSDKKSLRSSMNSALYLRVIGGTNFSFIDEWREYISRVFIFTFEI